MPEKNFSTLLDKMHAEQEKSGESLILGFDADLKEFSSGIRKKIAEFDYSKMSKNAEDIAQKRSLYPSIFDQTYDQIVEKTKTAIQEPDPKKTKNIKRDLNNLFQNVQSSTADMPELAKGVREVLDMSFPYIDNQLKQTGGLRGSFKKMKEKTGAGLANALKLGSIAGLGVLLGPGMAAGVVSATAGKLEEKRQFKAEEDKKIADMASKIYTGEESQKVTRLAEGGIVTKPTQALVGEKGPEAVLPLEKLGAFFKKLLRYDPETVAGPKPAEKEKTGGEDFDPSAWMDVVESEAERITATSTQLIVKQGEENKGMTEAFFAKEGGAIGLLERIRRGVGGVPLTFSERMKGHFTNLGGLFPHRRARKEQEKSALKQARRDQIQEDSSDQRGDIVEGVYDAADGIAELTDFMTVESRAEREARKEARRGKKEKRGKDKKKDPTEEGWFNWVILIGASLAGLAVGMMEGLAKIYKQVFTSIKTAIMESKLGKSIKNVFTMVKNTIMNSKIVQFFKGLFPAKEGGGIFKKAKDAIVKAWQTTKNTFLAVKNTVMGVINKIKTTFLTVKNAIINFFKPITNVIDTIKKFLGVGKEIKAVGGIATKTLGPVMGLARGLFTAFRTIGAKIMWPLQIIISFFDGIAEGGDALGKSVGFFASVINYSLGFAFGVIDGFFMGLFDFVKSIISWFVGALGFEELEKWLDSFSFSKMWNEFADGIYDVVNKLFMWKTWKTMFVDMWNWFKGLLDFSSFSAGLISIVKLIFLPLTALVKLVTVIWDWFKNLFTFEESEDAPPEDSRGFFGIIGDAVSAMWGWIKGIFTWGSEDEPEEEEGKGFMAYVGDAINTMWRAIKEVFTFGSDDEPEEEEGVGFLAYISQAISDMWTKIKSIFTWGSDDEPEEEEGTGFLTYISNAISSMWTKIKSIFTWGSDDEPIEVPGIGFLSFIGDAISAMWKNIKSIFTFGEEDGQEKGKGFLEILGDAISDMWESITSIFNKDWGKIISDWAKSIMPDWMTGWFFDDDEPKEGTADKTKIPDKKDIPKEETDKAGFMESVMGDMPDINGILNQVDWGQFDFGDHWFANLNFGEKLKGMLLTMFPADMSPKAFTPAKAGGIVGLSSFAAGGLGQSLGLESGGLFTLSQGEMVVPEPAVRAMSGQNLTELQRETTEVGGSAVGAFTIVNQSTVQNNASQPLLLPPPAVRPANVNNPASNQNNN